MDYTYKAKILRAVDGDTAVAEVDLGFHVKVVEKIRFARVNTAEIHGKGVTKESAEYAAGMLALDFVNQWFEKHNWEVVLKTFKDRTGKYGRFIAEVFSPDETENLQDLLIKEGMDKNNSKLLLISE